MAFGSSNLNILGHYWWQHPNVPRIIWSTQASLISWARGRLSKDDVCAVQTPGSPGRLLTSLVLCLFSPFFILLHSSWRVGCDCRVFWTVHSTCRTKPCVISADLMHPAATGWASASYAQRGEQPLLTRPPRQPSQQPAQWGPSILVKSMKALNRLQNQPASLANAPTRKSVLLTHLKEGTGYLATADLPAFWQPQLAWSHCPQDQSPLHLACAPQLLPSPQQPSYLLLRLQSCAGLQHSASPHPSKMALGG